MLNLAVNTILEDGPERAISYAQESIDALMETSSKIELSTALMAKATALSHVGEIHGASETIEAALILDQAEAVIEAADLADSFLDPRKAWMLLESMEGSPKSTKVVESLSAIQTARIWPGGEDMMRRALTSPGTMARTTGRTRTATSLG